MTRRLWALLLVVLVSTAGATAVLIANRPRAERAPRPQGPGAGRDLTLLVVRTPSSPFAAVIGSTGGPRGALVVPAQTSATVPGQGESTVGEALGLAPRQAATTVANLLGVWIEHQAVIGGASLASLVDRAGGLDVGGDRLGGAEVMRLLKRAGEGRTIAFALALQALLDADVGWQAEDLTESDDPDASASLLRSASGARVTTLSVAEVASGIFRAEPEATRRAVTEAFGGPDREVVPVIVLNGSGVPGVGEKIAERVVPGGFTVVVSENASTFDHEETLVVVGSGDDVVLAERVRDLLGVGSVNVSVPSGLAPVTIVVGKDFAG